MKTKIILASLLATSASLLVAAPASAQVSGIATANPVVAIGNSKAFKTAYSQIITTYKAALDQADAKEKAKQPLLAQLDKNGDKQVDDQELADAQAAKNPALAQVDQLTKEANTLMQPAILAEAFAIEEILKRYEASQLAVVNARKIAVILAPESFVYYPAAANVTAAITAQLDVSVPSVATTPTAGWQPQRQTIQLLQQLQQFQQYQAAAAAAANPPAPGAAAPAPTAPTTAPAPGKKPAGR